ncbi:MAG: phospholipase D family protein, partial [Pedobacter sp.]|nr:phospholipase D family protein [Pedobacter sp.]
TFTLNRMVPLIIGNDALVARLDIVEHAEKTIDLQYYIYHNDRAGRLLAHALLRAADRGVKVRALIDDIHGDDDKLVDAMNAHPNIELRHFNPFRLRKLRMLEVMLAFNRVDRRMHNKQLTVDGRFSIVGGRNIGDEYFGTSEESDFADLDVLVSGPVVQELENVFEEYWVSPRTKLISKNAEEKYGEQLAELRKQLAHQLREDEAQILPRLADAPYFKARQDGLHMYAECPTAVLADSPEEKDEKNGGAKEPRTHVGENLMRYLSGAEKDVLLISAYFVPGKTGTQALVDLQKRGVSVEVLTNSLASTDVSAVHAGYSRYRKPLLEAGARLWEMKPVLDVSKAKHFPLHGSSRASLHTKAYVFDERYFFVGSFNLDPRSAVLNTEMGLVFDCPAIAKKFRAGMTQALPLAAYRVRLDEKGELSWEDAELQPPEFFDKEPKARFWRRSSVWWLKLLPIEGEL